MSVYQVARIHSDNLYKQGIKLGIIKEFLIENSVKKIINEQHNKKELSLCKIKVLQSL